MYIFNQYSYIIISLIVFFTALFILYRVKRASRRVMVITQIAIVLVAIIGQLLLRPGSSTIDTLDEALNLLNNGQPTFLEFFSNYCAGCISVEPFVDDIMSRIQDDYNILRVDIHTELGRELRKELGFSFTPEFIIFDSSGLEIWRDHLPPTDDTLALVN